jgi:hypothetical protein
LYFLFPFFESLLTKIGRKMNWLAMRVSNWVIRTCERAKARADAVFTQFFSGCHLQKS